MKKLFKAAPGVAFVNGQAVPETGIIELTDIEALYDLAHGNIVADQAVAVPDEPPSRPRNRRAPEE